MTGNTNKERTSITIDPDLLSEAKTFCKEASACSTRKLSFSELVTQALRTFMHEEEDNEPTQALRDLMQDDDEPSAYTIHAD